MSGNANPVRSLWPQFFCQVYTILLYIHVYAHRQCSLWLCWKKLLSVVVSGESRVVRCLWDGASLTSSHLHHSPGLTTTASCNGFSGSSGRTPNNQDLSETAEKDSMNLPPPLTISSFLSPKPVPRKLHCLVLRPVQDKVSPAWTTVAAASVC